MTIDRFAHPALVVVDMQNAVTRPEAPSAPRGALTGRNKAQTALRQVVVIATRRAPKSADGSKSAAPISVGTIPYGVAIGAATWICLLGGGPF